MQAISRVDRLGAVAVTDWVVELTTHNFDGRSIAVNITTVIALPGCYLPDATACWVRLRVRAGAEVGEVLGLDAGLRARMPGR